MGCRFRNLAYTCKIILQQKLCQLHVIHILPQFVHPVAKMALYMYILQESYQCTPNPNGPLADRMPSDAISSTNRKVLGLVHQKTGQNSQTINTTQGPHKTLSYATFSLTKMFLPSSRVNPYPGARVPHVG